MKILRLTKAFGISIKALMVLICLATVIVYPVSVAHSQEKVKGYFKDDKIYLRGAFRAQRGAEIECSVKQLNNECCFEAEAGTVCVPKSDISSVRLDKRDYHLADIVISDSNNTKADACASGVPVDQRSDAFIWSYGFNVKSTDRIVDPILVELAISIRSNGILVSDPIIVKRWTGIPDKKCKSLNVTKNDIDEFLNKYRKIKSVLQVENDLSIDATASIQLFSSFKESNYKNNKIEFGVLLPADNSATWPPSNF